ncbi:conserved Plasmodium protein, unknown function [Plasmodium malariae]|uniref:Uncharacterized protein n=1 Tax=Plasmodium malariae TaxID=5858 RepID=A0A1D3JK25_PLAMA|nr:conserved Plasmodium protein, unknown function [Plasmodium malariae]SBT86750.1 conserved Plasmodium protein, unknown function [Plasmodium malariae]
MNHKIDIFLYICKMENKLKVEKDLIKKLIPTQKKFSKNMVVKYVLYNYKTKKSLIKKNWNINYILNKTKKKRKNKEAAHDKNISDKLDGEKKEVTHEHNFTDSHGNPMNNLLIEKSSGVNNNSSSYKKLLNKIIRNVKNGRNTTIVNTGVDTQKGEKNVFLYGHLFKKYLGNGNKKRGGNVEMSKCGETEEHINKQNIEELEEVKKNKISEENLKGDCAVKKSKNSYEKSKMFEDYLKKKRGLILDIYDYVVILNNENTKISISSWAYKNSKIIDMIKVKSFKETNRKSNRSNKTTPFCHRCFIKKYFDSTNFNYPKCCKNLPAKKVVKNGEHLRECLKRIIRKCVEIIKRGRGKTLNVCFIFKYKITINNQHTSIHLINFPLCNIEKNKIFYNSNNEKTLLFLFNKKIINSVKNINDYSNFIFPFNNSQECQRALNLKKKIIYFVSHRKCLFEKEEKVGTNETLIDIQQKEDSILNDYYTTKEMNNNREKTFTKYNKKEIIFHMHLFEILIRLIFKNSKTYFTFFISEQTYDFEFYKNIYYLNLSKVVNVKIKLKKDMKRRMIKKVKKKANKKVKKKMKKEKNNKTTEKRNILCSNDGGSLFNTLLKENDDCKNIINEKDKKIFNLQNEVQEKNKIVSNLEMEITKYKSEHFEKIKIIESLKNKISKKEATIYDNSIDDQVMKNSNYVKKLYNENNLLKEKMKRLNSSIKKDKIYSNTIGTLPNTKESSKAIIPSTTENAKEKDQNDKLSFFLKAFLDTEQKLYTADVVINTQKEIIARIKKEKNNYFEEVERRKTVFKKEMERSLDFIYSICEDIKTKKEKICLTNRINKLHDSINDFLGKFEKNY